MFASPINRSFLCTLVIAMFCSIGCSRSAQVAQTAAPVTATTKKPTAPRRSGLALLTAMALSDPHTLGYVNVAQLPHSSTYRAQLISTSDSLKEGIAELNEVCKQDFFQATSKLMVSISNEDVAIAATLKISAAQALTCARKLFGKEAKPWKHVKYRGIQREGLIFVAHDDWMVMTTEAAIDELLDRVEHQRGPARRDLPELSDTLLFSRAPLNDHTGIAAVSKRVRRHGDAKQLVITLHGASLEDADLIANALRQQYPDALAKSLQPLSRKLRQRLLRQWSRVEVSRKMGGTVEVVLPYRQTRSYRAAQELLTQGLLVSARRFRAEMKARENIIYLAAAAKRIALDDPKGGIPMFEHAAPRTPESLAESLIPEAERPADWHHQSWQKYRFSASKHDPFSYEIAVAQWGREAVVRAVSDIDADGELEVLELPLHVQGKHVSIGSVVRRGDAE